MADRTPPSAPPFLHSWHADKENITEDERAAVLKLLRKAITADRYPLSPRIRTLKSALAKLDPAQLVEPYPPPEAMGEQRYWEAKTHAMLDPIWSSHSNTSRAVPKRSQKDALARRKPAPVRQPPGMGRPGYACDWRCPIHGIEAAKKAIEAGKARLIRRRRENGRMSQPDTER